MRVLFCSRSFLDGSRRLAPLLSASGHELIVCAEREVGEQVGDVDVVIPLKAAVDASLFERGSFGLVQQFGVGLENVDIEAATRAGVWVARVPSAMSGSAASVAEHALLLMLALSRQLQAARQAVEQRRVGEPLGLALLSKTACIVGMGNIGTALAVRLRACGMRLLAVHAHPERGVPPETGIERLFALPELPAAVAEADYVVLCINYNASLHHLISPAVLAAMKPGTFLVNVARGGLIDPEVLSEALRQGRLAGAGLDVFEEEPMDPGHPLFRYNVIATPHLAGVTDASFHGTATVCADNIARHARGEIPLYAVNTPFSPRRRQTGGDRLWSDQRPSPQEQQNPRHPV